MEKTKIKLMIGGSEYYITTDDDPEYLISLGAELDEELKKVFHESPNVSTTQAAVLLALQYCDLYKKSEKSADNLRGQIKEYLEDSARARMESDVAHREIERLNREMQALRMRLADNGKKA